ncbi:hypothetical protein ABH944_002027 [Caballeronia udeis]|uniref:Uncharacterized protein n=1 Tax=Caballeronia udeis TaxID=1232866 RepID=A0ABW8MI39_9BURK
MIVGERGALDSVAIVQQHRVGELLARSGNQGCGTFQTDRLVFRQFEIVVAQTLVWMSVVSSKASVAFVPSATCGAAASSLLPHPAKAPINAATLIFRNTGNALSIRFDLARNMESPRPFAFFDEHECASVQ